MADVELPCSGWMQEDRVCELNHVLNHRACNFRCEEYICFEQYVWFCVTSNGFFKEE